MNNAGLIKALRECEYCNVCSFAVDGECPFGGRNALEVAAADAFETAEKRIAELEAQMLKGEIVPCDDCKYRALASIGICWNKKLACVAGKRKENH